MKKKINAYFILGFVCLVLFMSGGFLSCLAVGQGQLRFSFIWLILAPIPFGIVFTITAFALLQISKREIKPNPSYTFGLIFLATAIIPIYAAFMIGLISQAVTFVL